MKIYVAGPMTGYPDLNFPLFHSVTKRLRELGHTVVNPAEINADPAKAWADCMKADIIELLKCDSICLLDGWEVSRGARLEYTIAVALGMHSAFAEVMCNPTVEAVSA